MLSMSTCGHGYEARKHDFGWQGCGLGFSGCAEQGWKERVLRDAVVCERAPTYDTVAVTYGLQVACLVVSGKH